MRISNFNKARGLKTIVLLLLFSVAVEAATKNYNANSAANYAKSFYNTPYNSTNGGNPFTNFVNLNGGNCTNFVSQALIAGLTGKNNPKDVFAERVNFTADKSALYLSWYFLSNTDRGPAWTGASKLYEYARSNRSSYKGLHFSFVTNDSPTKFMDYNSVRVGDVIFADWTSDGTIDHAMIVTVFSNSIFNRGYNHIRVTYQGGEQNPVGKTDKGLGDINDQYNKRVSFYVYRPLDYKDTGL